jgi:chromate transporter
MVPGPLFSVAAWLGATLPATSTVVALGTALLALVAIFLPGLLIALGSLRLFHRMRALPQIRCVIAGLNAGVVGLLVAVCYDPIFTTAILARSDLAFALLSFTALVVMRWSSIVVVAGCTVLVYGWGTILNA